MVRYLQRLKQGEEDAGLGVQLMEQPEWQGPLLPKFKSFKEFGILVDTKGQYLIRLL